MYMLEVRDILHPTTCNRRYGNGVSISFVTTVGNHVYPTEITVHLNSGVP